MPGYQYLLWCKLNSPREKSCHLEDCWLDIHRHYFSGVHLYLLEGKLCVLSRSWILTLQSYKEAWTFEQCYSPYRLWGVLMSGCTHFALWGGHEHVREREEGCNLVVICFLAVPLTRDRLMMVCSDYQLERLDNHLSLPGYGYKALFRLNYLRWRDLL